MTAHVPVQISANNHIIAKLIEPKIGANVPPGMCGGVYRNDNEPIDSIVCTEYIVHNIIIVIYSRLVGLM